MNANANSDKTTSTLIPYHQETTLRRVTWLSTSLVLSILRQGQERWPTWLVDRLQPLRALAPVRINTLLKQSVRLQVIRLLLLTVRNKQPIH